MFALVAIAATAGAQGGVAINSTNFPSTNFRKFVKDNYDKDGDNFLSDAEIAAVTKINVYGKSIGDLKGIERFTALKELDCRKNGLLELDLSKNTALTRLLCSSNSLNVLDVSQNTALTELECSENKLTRLNVSKNTALTELWCDINQIKAPAMRKLLESLPEVSRGTLGVIDTKSSNEQNVITVPQVAIAKGKGWSVLDLNGGSSYIPYAGSDPGLEINATNFPDENFRSCVLDFIDEDEDGYLSDEERSLRGLNLGFTEGNIASLKGIELFTELEELYCWDNQLTSLDVSKNTKLKQLGCSSNQLTSLDVSKNTALLELDCADNKLTSLDLSQNTKLYQLECGNNQLTSLDLSHNTKLFQLECGNNQLTSLDVSKNTALRVLFCHGNQIKGDKMQALVNSLPTASGVDGKFYVIDSKDSNEGNVITKSQVAIAKGKSWKVYDYETVDGGHSPVEYDGSDDDAAADTYVISFTQKVTDLSTFGPQAEMAIPYLPLLGIVDQEQRDGLTVFKSKPGGKELMVYDPSAKTITVCDGVTSADNISYEISPEIHQLIKIMNKNVDPFEGYNRLLIKFEVGATGIGGVEADGLDKAAWYTLDGKKISGEPTRKGVYIYKGRKVVK